MSKSKLIELTYYDPGKQIRLTTYADTIITDQTADGKVICAIRFGGYPEMVQAMSDALYGGVVVDAIQNGATHHLKSNPKGYQRQLSPDGGYATATLMMKDDPQSANPSSEEGDETPPEGQQTIQPRKCYIFCPAGDRDRLFDELDRKTAAPLIPAFRDYVLDQLIARLITLAVFLILYETIMFAYTKQMEKLSVKEIMLD